MSSRVPFPLLTPALALLAGGGAAAITWSSLVADAAAVAGATPAGLLLPLLLASLWSLALAWAGAAWVGRETDRRQRGLDRLTNQAQALAEGRLETLGDPAATELAALGTALNALALHLRGAFDGAPEPVARLRRHAQTDLGTGLDNRAVFLERLTSRLDDSARPDCALLWVRLPADTGRAATVADLDRHGRVLQAMSDMLGNYPERVPGAFVGRLGEHDFGLCLPAHGVAAETATTLLAAWRAGPVGQLGGVPCVVGVIDRIGGQSLSLVLATAEQAARDAELRGPYALQVGCLRAPQDHDPSAGRLGILQALDEGRARLAEYPVVDRQGRLLHLECPLRLQREVEGGWEPAERWLPTAYRHRLMAQVDLKAVQLALRGIGRDGVPRCAHVSAQSLNTAGFASAVRELLEADRVAAARLWIEISEVSFDALPPRLRNACTAWRRGGVRLGIEHAGASLSKLVGIEDLGLDYVKVASDFAAAALDHPVERDTARAIVALAHSLGAMVIAEGVARAEDMSALWALGFDGLTGSAVTAGAAATGTVAPPESAPLSDDQATVPA
jgi:EAL domain-containing protein (putative c-di-GMP-specific phosphodiesterase class I)/GGDEF domain-containing protein